MAKSQSTEAYAYGSANVIAAVKAISHADFGFTAAELAKAESCWVRAADDAAGCSMGSIADPAGVTGPLILASGGAFTEVSGNANVVGLRFFGTITPTVVHIILFGYPG